MRRGIEGWLQHELAVAIVRAGHANILPDFGDIYREAIGDVDRLDQTGSKKRPYDLYLEDPALAFALKVYTENRTHGQAATNIETDIKALAENQGHKRGVFILCRFDTRFESLEDREEIVDSRRGKHGRDWCDAAMNEAGTNYKLKSLIADAMDYDDNYVDFHLAEDIDAKYNRIIVHEMTFGAWTVRGK